MSEISGISDGIRKIIESNFDSKLEAESITTKILEELDRHRVLYYSDPAITSLLNIHGRVLIAVMEDPGITQRALSQYLRVSESNIQKSLAKLFKDGLIYKKKVGSRNHYQFSPEALKHPDIHRFYNQITKQIQGLTSDKHEVASPHAEQTPLPTTPIPRQEIDEEQQRATDTSLRDLPETPLHSGQHTEHFTE